MIIQNQIYTLILILFGTSTLHAQYDRDNYVIDAFFGRNLIHDFSQPPMELEIDTGLYFYGPDGSQAHRFDVGSITMSDTAGRTQFVSNMCHSWTADGQLIPGTEEAFIFSELGKLSFCDKGGVPGTRQLLVLPIPDHPNNYYYIYAKERFELFGGGDFEIYEDSLYYRVLDMDANDGLGQMSLEEHFLLADTTLDPSTMAATRHANGVEWWLTICGANHDTYVLSVDSNIIVPRDTQSWFEPYEMGDRGFSQSTFSPNGGLYARATITHGLTLADFDQQSGEFKNIQVLPYQEPDEFFVGSVGVAFSGNNRFLYVNSDSRHLIQYDMEEPGLTGFDTLWVFSEEEDIVNDEDLGTIVFYMKTLKLGKDCKIYSMPFSRLPFLHVVHNPNAAGEDAMFRRADYRAPAGPGGLGHHPHWRTATPQEDWCAEVYYDSVYTSAASPQAILAAPDWQLAPNPVRDVFRLQPLESSLGPAELVLYDQQGRVVRRWQHSGIGSDQFELHGIPVGVYILRIYGADASGSPLPPAVKKVVLVE